MNNFSEMLSLATTSGSIPFVIFESITKDVIECRLYKWRSGDQVAGHGASCERAFQNTILLLSKAQQKYIKGE